MKIKVTSAGDEEVIESYELACKPLGEVIFYGIMYVPKEHLPADPAQWKPRESQEYFFVSDYLDNVTLGCIIGFHLAPQTATGRTSPIDQMCDHQLGCLLGRQLRYGQHRLQQLSHVGRRERR